MNLNDPNGLKVPSEQSKVNQCRRRASGLGNILLLMFGSSRSGCLGVAISWTILCVFCDDSHENQRYFLDDAYSPLRPRHRRRSPGVDSGPCIILLTVCLEAFLPTEERTLDSKPKKRASATVAC